PPMCIGVGLRGTDSRRVPPVLGAVVKVVVERSIRESCVVHLTRALASPSVVNPLTINFRIPPSSKNCGKKVFGPNKLTQAQCKSSRINASANAGRGG